MAVITGFVGFGVGFVIGCYLENRAVKQKMIPYIEKMQELLDKYGKPDDAEKEFDAYMEE